MHDPRSSLNRLLAALEQPRARRGWEPAVDMYRCADGWLLKFELAGVRPEDIQVRLDTRGVTVFGSRLDRSPYQVGEAHLIEIAYSQFERFVALPEPLENVQFRVDYRDGMLYVQVLRGDSNP